MNADGGEQVSRPERWLGLSVPVTVWSVYAPIGVKNTALLLLMGLSIAVINRKPAGWRSLVRTAAFVMPAALASWLVLSALWSPADVELIVTHSWSYTLPLCAVVLAAACPAAAARRALIQFVVASALIGALWALNDFGLLPASGLLDSTVNSKGNQRIASSVLMALAVTFAFWFASRPGERPIVRTAFVGAALLALSGLLSQDRRTGMVLLPLLLLAWACAAPHALRARLALTAAVLACGVGVWLGSDNVRARFAEGTRELQTYRSDGAVLTSWGQRVRMVQITSEIVRENPLVGHGVGSWVPLWKQRTTPGTLLWDNTTPHNEYLLVATQGGVFAAVLLAAWFVLMMAHAVRAGAPGRPALLLWLAVAATALANATIRDAKLAVPLLLLAGMAQALYRRGEGE